MRVAGWLIVLLGLLIGLVGGYLLSQFVQTGPHLVLAYVWSGGLVVVGLGTALASGFSGPEVDRSQAACGR
jgi:hypothetical protein